METSQREPSYRRAPDEPDLDLYTIPSHSSWFSWDDIHETEKLALKEFFDGSSISRTPRIYKEYRDFIINKYREEPSSMLTFTEIRKSLVGDVNLLHKVFAFLETWGLINFGATSDEDDLAEVEDGESYVIKIEEGVPNGIRVGAMPNSVKPISAPPVVEDNVIVNGRGFKLPPLTSYSDVFSDLLKQKILVCGNCGQLCGSRYHQCAKDGKYGEQRLLEDFELKTTESTEDRSSTGAVWTEAETLLLLESVLKHGDDWELVAQNVQTKTKLDCILKFVELPFGDSLLCSEAQRNEVSGPNNNVTSEKETTDGPPETTEAPPSNQEIAGSEDQCTKDINEDEDGENQGPPKRQCTASLQDTSSSLMKQVALISSMVGPQIMAAAATASVTALCDENSYPKEIFDDQNFFVPNGLCSAASTTSNHEVERILNNEDSVAKERPQSGDIMAEDKDDIPLILRVRAAIATALGAAAAHAKLLADQEEREMEYLLAIMIETQMKKMQRKIKHFEDLELIMETEYPVIEELEDKLLMERVSVLQSAFDLGIPRWKDYPSVRS
ncbi:SWI/SNF complex subunit SWI3A isoform X2 [Cucumis melo]|uniref:SWI/SNF complex subunit SWI3A isoform X2 n=1 Tax=Cucumis melo TaxID=3656 RepID=A0ABM3KI30_CUCME|nr:SWI/SNF complex subunit SWI3A isoform X2 [Cucumis melo]